MIRPGFKAVEKLGFARAEAKQICSSNSRYQAWLNKIFDKNPADRRYFAPELINDLETEAQNESISNLANDLSVSSIEDDLYKGHWGQDNN